MRGETSSQDELFSYVSIESHIPVDHPIRKIRKVVDKALADIDSAFDDIYSNTGRPPRPNSSSYRLTWFAHQ